MKAFTISAAVALLAALAQAAPAATTTPTVTCTFTGAAASYTQTFPRDGSVQPITNPISVDHINCSDPHADCTFYGKDGSVTPVSGTATATVGPPQTQVSGTCHSI